MSLKPLPASKRGPLRAVEIILRRWGMKPSFETPPPSLPHRRSHLPSRTYRSLVRICSDFHGESRVSLATPSVLQELLLRSDNNAYNEAAQVSREEACEPGETFHPDNTQSENLGMVESKISEYEKCSTDGGHGGLLVVLDDIESAGTEVMDTTNQENELMLGDVFGSTDLLDGVVDLQQMLMDELELIVNGNKDLVPENCVNPLETSSGVNHSGVIWAASVEDNATQQSEPVENDVEKTFESIDLSVEKGVVQEVSKSGDCMEGRSSGETKKCEEEKLTGMEQEKSIGLVDSVAQMLEDEDIEEGEVFGDLDISFDDLLLGDDEPVERMNEKHVSERETASSHVNHHTGKESSGCNPLSMVVSLPEFVEGAEGRQSRNKPGAEVAYSCSQVIQDVRDQEKSDDNASESHETLSAEKLDAASCGKSKSASAETERKKSRNKERCRRKRAEKNRLLGVNRLKLKPVVKPKPVEYCRRYLKGRCHEGENCRYSHDAVPLTKFLPCCHFATQSCMKGDDCPFDHDLSKYPCTNFNTKGFCNRGDNCLFSHKLQGSSQSPLDASKLETAPSSTLPVSHSKEKPNKHGISPNNDRATSFSFGVLPQRRNKQTMTETITSQSMSLARVRSPLASVKQLSQPNQGSSFSKISELSKAESLIRKPSVAPKGINFLSFNKTSLEDGPKILSSVGDATTSLHEQAGSSSVENLRKVEYQNKTATQSTPSTNQNSNELLKRSSLRPTVVLDTMQTSSEQRVSGHIKATPESQSQKTLISALKLAAEFECERMKKPTNVAGAVNQNDSERTNVARSSRNTSKVLEFLSSFSSSKQSQ